MSSSTAIPIQPDLEQAFKTGNYRFIVVRIENEVLVKIYAHPQGGSLESDWRQIAEHAGEKACYVLVRVEPGKWITITYVPDSTSVKDKMVLAATKSTLLNHLGYQNFGDDLHATTAVELSYNHYQGTLKPYDARTNSEEIRDVVAREENEERSFRIGQQASRGIGGYHSVAMPMDESAKNLVRGISSGTHSFIELAVNSSKDGITGISGKSGSSFGSFVNGQEPRYYMVKHQGRNVFIYCCPPKAPQQLRMVYSTAKGSVISEAKSLGFNVNKTGEISEGSELTDGYLRDLASSGPVRPTSMVGPSRAAISSSDGQVRAARQSVVTTAHPIYSLMGSGNGGSQRSKKVVLPPPGAY